MDSQSLSLQLQCPPLQQSGSLRLDDEKSHSLGVSSPASALSSPEARSPFETPASSDVESFDIAKEPSSGPQRSKLSPMGKGGKEKRKRSRVNPEQLVHLERFFLQDRSPTAIRRKEISDMLGMQERQTQIWFQNRRAKAKLQDGRPKMNDSIDVSSLDHPSHLNTRRFSIQSLIHEDEAVTIIPCTDLSIGSWRRVSSTSDSRDLIAYVCEAKQCITWFIHSVGYGFKMEIDFDTIVDAEFTSTTLGSGMIAFTLSQPPLFYLESTTPPLADGSVQRYWKQCADWTEGHQATQVLRHELIGSATHLAQLVARLRSGVQSRQLSHSPYSVSVSGSSAPSTPVESIYSAELTGYRRGSDMDHPGFGNNDHFNPSRSSYAKGLLDANYSLQTAPRLGSAPPTAPLSQLPSATSSVFSDFSGFDEPQHTLNVSEYRRASAPVLYGQSRSYVTQSLAQPRLSLYQQPRSMSQFPSMQSQLSFGNNSTPSLNLPFLPQQDFGSNETQTPNQSMLSGLVGYPFEADDNYSTSQGSFLGLNPSKEAFVEENTTVP